MDNAAAAPVEDHQQAQAPAEQPQAVPDTSQGQAERPEWLPEKFKSAEDLYTSYSELEKKLGQPKEAPEEYGLNLEGELLSQLGMESIEELQGDEMVTGFLDMAKEEGVSQAFVDKVLGWYLQGDAELLTNEAARQKQEIAALGARGTERIRDIADFTKQAPEAIHQKAIDLLQDAASVEVFEWMMSQGKEASLPMGEGTPTQSREQAAEDLKKMQFEKDEQGNRRMSTDPAFAKRVRELQKKVYGNAPAMDVVR